MENNAQLYELLARSWEFCKNENVPQDIEFPLLRLTKEELKMRQEKKRFDTNV